MEIAKIDALNSNGTFWREAKATMNGRPIEASAPELNIAARRGPLTDLSDILSTFKERINDLLAMVSSAGIPSLYTEDLLKA
jgi:hypothetical protein